MTIGVPHPSVFCLGGMSRVRGPPPPSLFVKVLIRKELRERTPQNSSQNLPNKRVIRKIFPAKDLAVADSRFGCISLVLILERALSHAM